jgi:hypothetical protein
MASRAKLWKKEDLAGRVCKSLEIALRTVEEIADLGYSDSQTGEVVPPEKIISETGLLLVCSLPPSLGSDDIQEWHERVARALIPLARSERIRAGICLEPALAREYAYAHACLSHLGYTDLRFDRLLSESVSSRAASGRERLPHKQLEQEWLRRLWDPAPQLKTRPDVTALSVLGSSLDALASARDDVYAFTHALMYVTDLGLRRPPLPRSAVSLAADAEAALAWSLDEQDYDLAGELLLTWPLLGCHWSPGATFAFQVLARVEDLAGFLPAPAIRLDHYGSLSDSERTKYAIATTYHTAYVMGLLCSLLLLPGRAPPASVPRRHSARRQHSGHAVFQLVGRDGHQRHWLDSFARLTDGQQEALDSFMFIMCLRRAVTNRDLSLLQKNLLIGRDNDLLKGPAPQQALELLSRSCLFNSSI